MAEIKTTFTDKSVEKYIDTLPNERKQNEAREVLSLLEDITETAPCMWGPSIIGFDRTTYKYGELPLLAFSPRKTNFVFYIINDSEEQKALLAKLGKHRTGKVCLYVNKLADINYEILEQLLRSSWERALKGHKNVGTK